jgi:hypothetical protein
MMSPGLEVKHEGLEVLSHDEVDRLVVGSVAGLVFAVELGVEVQEVAGGKGELVFEGEGGPGPEVIGIRIACELVLEPDDGVTDAKGVHGGSGCRGGPGLVGDEGNGNVEFPVLDEADRETLGHGQRAHAEAGSQVVKPVGFVEEGAHRLHFGRSRKHGTAGVGAP